MSMIKQLMEVNAEFDQQVDDLIDKAQEHTDYEEAIQSINLKKDKKLMKKILSGLSKDTKLIAGAMSNLGA
jgi:hypothetical protein